MLLIDKIQYISKYYCSRLSVYQQKATNDMPIQHQKRNRDDIKYIIFSLL